MKKRAESYNNKRRGDKDGANDSLDKLNKFGIIIDQERN